MRSQLALAGRLMTVRRGDGGRQLSQHQGRCSANQPRDGTRKVPDCRPPAGHHVARDGPRPAPPPLPQPRSPRPAALRGGECGVGKRPKRPAGLRANPGVLNSPRQCPTDTSRASAWEGWRSERGRRERFEDAWPAPVSASVTAG